MRCLLLLVTLLAAPAFAQQPEVIRLTTDGHLKQRLRPMRGFKQLTSADGFICGHALVQYLRYGFSSLTDRVSRPMRLATAWPHLARAI